jgi:ketosteroid isomerase-like protein
MPPYNVVKAKEAALSKVTLTNLVDIYDARRDHDLDRLASHLPPDFSHSLNIPREMLAVGGMREGKAETIFRLQEIFEGFDTQYIEPGQMTLDESRAVLDVRTRCKHRLSGKWLDTAKKHVWLLEDGWPVRLSEFYDLEQFAAFMKTTR